MRVKRANVSFCLLLLLPLVFTACKKNIASAPPASGVAPSPPPPAPAITLRANPLSVDSGGTVALQWTTTNAGTVRIEPGLGSVPTDGARLVNPTSSVTYIATAYGPGGSASDSARITVRVAAAPPAASNPGGRTNASLTELFGRNLQTIYFEYDEAEISPDQASRLLTGAAWLKQRADVKFTIEGYCDERGSEEYNLGLGDRRANRVKEYLVQHGIDASRMNVVSYGEERPVCREAAEECRRRNRRAAFALQSSQ